jgi:N-acetylmuramoyl-L-alanine amidase
VLALNYPGSTGRGARYESRFTTADVADALQAALDYLWSQHVDTVVSWSISTGHRVQAELLAHRFGVSAVIDQAGRDPRGLRPDAERQHVPYLSISGVNDDGGTDPSVDVPYPGGHDITVESDFRMVLDRVRAFLDRAPPWRYQAPPSLDGGLVLDPAHTGNPRDPNRHGSLAEADLTFELARVLLHGCLAGRPVVLTRTGQPTLERGPAASVRARAALLDVDPTAAMLSLHFNASPPHAHSDDLTSAFVSIDHDRTELELARGLVEAMQTIGVAPKLGYPELAHVPLASVAPGVFSRDLYLLRRSPHVRQHARRAAPRVLFEALYYDDEAESRRLRERTLDDDGIWVRPRLREIGDAICPAVSRFLDEAAPPKE